MRVPKLTLSRFIAASFTPFEGLLGPGMEQNERRLEKRSWNPLSAEIYWGSADEEEEMG